MEVKSFTRLSGHLGRPKTSIYGTICIINLERERFKGRKEINISQFMYITRKVKSLVNIREPIIYIFDFYFCLMFAFFHYLGLLRFICYIGSHRKTSVTNQWSNDSLKWELKIKYLKQLEQIDNK